MIGDRASLSQPAAGTRHDTNSNCRTSKSALDNFLWGYSTCNHSDGFRSLLIVLRALLRHCVSLIVKIISFTQLRYFFERFPFGGDWRFTWFNRKHSFATTLCMMLPFYMNVLALFYRQGACIVCDNANVLASCLQVSLKMWSKLLTQKQMVTPATSGWLWQKTMSTRWWLPVHNCKREIWTFISQMRNESAMGRFVDRHRKRIVSNRKQMKQSASAAYTIDRRDAATLISEVHMHFYNCRMSAIFVNIMRVSVRHVDGRCLLRAMTEV